jgi:hypothetical protein
MKASIFFNSKGYLFRTARSSFHIVTQQFFDTPERALSRAYQAALLIKSIEDAYFCNDKKPTKSSSSEHYTESLLRDSFKDLLHVVKFRLAEFRVSHSIFGHSIFTRFKKLELINQQVKQLQLIDEILDRYTSKQNLAHQQTQTSSNLETDQFYPMTIDVVASEITSKKIITQVVTKNLKNHVQYIFRRLTHKI